MFASAEHAFAASKTNCCPRSELFGVFYGTFLVSNWHESGKSELISTITIIKTTRTASSYDKDEAMAWFASRAPSTSRPLSIPLKLDKPIQCNKMAEALTNESAHGMPVL